MLHEVAGYKGLSAVVPVLLDETSQRDKIGELVVRRSGNGKNTFYDIVNMNFSRKVRGSLHGGPF